MFKATAYLLFKWNWWLTTVRYKKRQCSGGIIGFIMSSILIIAFVCVPNWTSEPGVGWKNIVVHHLTFGSIFFTPWAAKYTDRLVWGPIGGASGAMEYEFLKNEGFKSCIAEAFYRVVAWYSFHPAPWAAKLRKKCRAILFRTSELAASVKLEPHQLTAVVPETAYAGEIKPRQYVAKQHPLKILCVGRLIPLKGVKYTIKAFAEFIKSGGEGELHIYGDGPLRSELESFVTSLTTEDQRLTATVFFYGNVPNAEIHAALDSADVLVHSSFREGGSWTILEAMAHGVPVICQDRAGMKDMVTDECGTKIRVLCPDKLVDSFAESIGMYYYDFRIIHKKGEMGRLRVNEQYKWVKCGALIDEIYAEVADERET